MPSTIFLRNKWWVESINSHNSDYIWCSFPRSHGLLVCLYLVYFNLLWDQEPCYLLYKTVPWYDLYVLYLLFFRCTSTVFRSNFLKKHLHLKQLSRRWQNFQLRLMNNKNWYRSWKMIYPRFGTVTIETSITISITNRRTSLFSS